MVVVLILAVLIAMAVPTFVGGRSRSQDVAARANLDIAATAARLVGSEESLALVTKAALQSMEPSLSWNDEDVASNGPTEIAWSTGPDPEPTNLVVVVKSASGTAFYQVQSEVPLLGTGGARTAFILSGSFDAGGGVAASPDNARRAARGEAPAPSEGAPGPTEGEPAVPTTTTLGPTTTTVAPTTTTTVPACKGKKVYDPVKKKCRKP